MIKPKKPIAFVCAAALLLSPTGALGASPSDFVDFPNDWSQGAMTAAVENGLLGGVGDGRIAPQGEVTRAQMAAIINRAFGAEKQASLSSYSDVAADAWYAVDMAKAVQMGTFSGTGNGLLEPDRAITREEAFSVLARAFALEAGDDSSLASFSDGAQVSSWAKGSVSAMVAAGCVNGSDGNRLNPQQTITRAEFAAVMSKIVAQYIDADSTLNRSLEIDGNVIVRGNVDLSGYTINGDVIIADEATNVTLDGVTVNGRLVVRGASDSLTINDSSADGVIITNPNGASVLKTDNASDLGTVTALGDLTLSGGQLDRLTIAESATITVEKDASVETITVSADDVTINGAGKVGKVQANADNVHVNVEDAEVTAGKGTSGVTAGDTSVAPGESATVSGDSDNDSENTGSNTGNGGSSGGNNNNPGDSTDTPGTDNPGGSNDNPGTTPGGGESTGDNTNPGGSEETPAAAIINAETTKLVDLGWSQYVTVQFTKGHTLDNTILTIDGTDVTKACTPVTDDGSIVKWEITDLNPAQLVATSAGESQTDTLSKNASPKKPEVVTDTAPDYMIAHGAVAVWDYHLTNYDKDGNVRIEPSKTTFNISGETASDVPAFYSADAELSAQGSGSVTIKFAQKTDADKAWFTAIPENGALKLVAYNENQNVLNNSLNYTKNSNGTLTIALGQTNFTSNGRYYVSVQSSGHDTALVPIHVVNEKAPSLTLSGSGMIVSGKNVSFKINDMTFGDTNPTYAAELTRPDGTTVSLEMITDWYQIGDSLVLYNDTNNNIPYNGSYTLTVHSNGFKDMRYTFTVTDGQTAPKAANRSARSLNVDAVSRATSTGGTGGGSSEGGGVTMSADLKFDADLLINAKLLVNLGIANDDAKAINDRWEYEMSGWDSVWSDSEDKGYKWNDYITAVSNARTQGEYLTFAEYADGAQWDSNGAPYAIKSVLEDNLLGETQYNGSWVGQTAPGLTLVDSNGQPVDAVTQGNDIILKGDAEYLKKVDSLNVNNWSLDLPKSDYTIDGDTLTIKKDALGLENPGSNKIVLYADGYRANYLNVTMSKNLETGLSLAVPDNINSGDNLRIEVTGSTGDFGKHLTTVTLQKPDGSTTSIYPYGVGSYDDDYYQFSNDNVVTIVDKDGSVFDQDGTYTVTLDARYYNSLSATFNVTGEAKTAPQATGAEKSGENYVIHFGDSATSDWKNAITSITVNGKTYTEKDTITDLGKNQYQWDNIHGTFDLTLQGRSFDQDENTIVIKATGYNDTTIKVTSEGSLVGAPEDPAEEAKPAPAAPTATVDEDGNVTLAFDSVDSSWKSAISSVEVNGVGYSAFNDYFGTPGEKNYQWKIDAYGGQKLYLDKISFVTGGNTVVIKAEGYKDLTVTVKIDGEEEPGDTIKDVPEVTYKNYGHGTAYLYIDNGSMSSTDGANYVNAISRITVDGTEYSEAWGNSPSANEYATSSSTPYIAFTESTFSSEKDTVVVVEADGYKTLTVTVHSDGTYESSTSDPGESDESQPAADKDAPSVSGASKDYSNNYVLGFDGISDDSWKEIVSSGKGVIKVNDVTYSLTDSFSLGDNQYQWSSYGPYGYPELTFDSTSFTKEQNTITISAEGYKDLTITIDKDGYIV